MCFPECLENTPFNEFVSKYKYKILPHLVNAYMYYGIITLFGIHDYGRRTLKIQLYPKSVSMNDVKGPKILT